MREFATGATRDGDETKLDYEGFLSPLVIERFGQYMHEHRKQADGELRSSDNWQKGIPRYEYLKSGWRHFFDLWKFYRASLRGEVVPRKLVEDAACALFFNIQGYLHEWLLGRDVQTSVPGQTPEFVQGWSKHDSQNDLPLYLSELVDWGGYFSRNVGVAVTPPNHDAATQPDELAAFSAWLKKHEKRYEYAGEVYRHVGSCDRDSRSMHGCSHYTEFTARLTPKIKDWPTWVKEWQVKQPSGLSWQRHDRGSCLEFSKDCAIYPQYLQYCAQAEQSANR